MTIFFIILTTGQVSVAKMVEIPTTYIGWVVSKSIEIGQAINNPFGIKDGVPLFHILMGVVNKEFKAGDNIEATIRIINIGDLEHIDVLLHYAIKDSEGKTLLFKEESITIEGEFEVSRDLEIPKGLQEGEYLFYSKVSYEDSVATNIKPFKVVS